MPTSSELPHLVLASSSPYRRALLARLGIPFQHASPTIDETALPDEGPAALVERLSHAKARALVATHPHSLLIGSDQTAWLPHAQRMLGKPGNAETAAQQLAACSGKRVVFYTGLCVLDSRRPEQPIITHDLFTVHFRELSTTTIHHYLDTEQPYDCAGSFRVEGLGIALFSHLEGRDPNSLIGLPMIALVDALSHLNYDVLEQAYRNRTLP